MKINAIHLESCCDWSKPGPSKTGCLYKKSESKRTFHLRRFLLRDNLLFYFNQKKSSDSVPLGLIILEGCCVERLDGLSFLLSFPGSGARNYILAAKTEEEVDGWMEAIAGAGFDSMQYAIKELEAQLQKLSQIQMQADIPTNSSSSTEPICCNDPSSEESKLEKTGICSGAEINEVERNSSSFEATLDSTSILQFFLKLHKQYGDYIETKTKERPMES